MSSLPALVILTCCIVALAQGAVADALDEKAFTAKVQRYVKILERLQAFRPELPPHVLAQAVGMQGNRERLEKAIVKMIRGDHMTIALMGGSLSLRGFNHPDESYISQVHKWLELTFVEGCRDAAVASMASAQSEQGASARRLRQHQGQAHAQSDLTARRSVLKDPFPKDVRADPAVDLQAMSHPEYLKAGHICPQSRMQLVNLAVGAAGPGFSERCQLQHLPDNVDLLFVDFGCNDHIDSMFFSHPERHAYERILRHALSRPKLPALISFEAFSWEHSAALFYGRQVPNLAQDKHQIITEYYGDIQVLSVRAALYQIMNATDHPQKLVYVAKEAVVSDFVHVSLLGHRWYADIIISYLQGVAMDVVSKLIALEGFKATLQPGQDSEAAQVMHTQLFADSSSVYMPVEAGSCSVEGRRGVNFPVNCSEVLPGLPPPFFPGNEVHPFGVCAVGEEFAGSVAAPHEGWDWLDEGQGTAHKWGFVSTKVGAELTIKVALSLEELAAAHTTAKGSSKPHRDDNKILAWLIYLESYSEMGRASVSCAGGCTCSSFEVDAHKMTRQSVPALKGFTMYPKDSDASHATQEDCQVKVKVLADSSSGGHKFKAIGITTSATTIWHIEDIFKRGTAELGPGHDST